MEVGTVQNSKIRPLAPGLPLQVADRADDVGAFRIAAGENDRLNSFAKDADGNVYIPISRAIDLLAQRGLPAVSGKWSPTAPVAVPAGESRSSSHEAKTPRGAIKGVTR